MGAYHGRLLRLRESAGTRVTETQGPESLDDLPDELLVAVARRLDCMAIHSTMPRVSQRWRAIVSNRALLGPPSCYQTPPGRASIDRKEASSLYVHARTCPRHRLACADAIRAGAGPAALARLKALGHAYNEDAVMAAVLADDIPCLAVLRASKTSIKNKHYEAAAKHGRVDALAWLFAHEGVYSWHSAILAMAAQHGHLECLKLAHQSGVKWDEEVAVAAARGGHVDCLAYVRDYGCPWEPRTAYQEAHSHGHKACCDYIARHTTERLPNEPWDVVFDTAEYVAMLAVLFYVVFLCVAGVVRLVGGAPK
ncbi:Ankyrin repeat domain containing protein [Pandoravirus dulcis]|uniref:Ankyrin repeat domain containing protein n=1 Tax=Pandoravirus dulcis TaxID=1349409 RepID=S4VTU1_9VIRU|nr:Ankyrin repeat domain containing protein [Pandoravirus dulcis]AGO82840.1 Ankyrin repeat domain containing protein [Pandoravirus dulcis]